MRVSRSEDVFFQMCGDVYNYMINETMIQQNEYVVVFNLDTVPSSVTSGWFRPVLVGHATFARIAGLEKHLMDILSGLLFAERKSDFFALKAIMQNGRPLYYASCGFASPDIVEHLTAMGRTLSVHGKMKPLEEMLSIKPITYL